MGTRLFPPLKCWNCGHEKLRPKEWDEPEPEGTHFIVPPPCDACGAPGLKPS